jgi:hypothetical protein
MITHTQFLQMDVRSLIVDIQRMEREGWSVRSIVPVTTEEWLIVYERPSVV